MAETVSFEANGEIRERQLKPGQERIVMLGGERYLEGIGSLLIQLGAEPVRKMIVLDFPLTEELTEIPEENAA